MWVVGRGSQQLLCLNLTAGLVFGCWGCGSCLAVTKKKQIEENRQGRLSVDRKQKGEKEVEHTVYTKVIDAEKNSMKSAEEILLTLVLKKSLMIY